MKRLAIIFCSMLITINILPVITGNFVFADTVPDGFTQVNSVADQVLAFQYYCKSRNLAIEGSVLDAVTQVTTKAYQKAVEGAGLDMNTIQAELYKNTSIGQSFFYTVSGVSAMNRIFAEFLQNNDLEVGDEVENQNLYSGRWFVDADGNGCLVYVVNYNSTTNINAIANSSSLGTPYKMTGSDILDSVRNSSPLTMSQHLTEDFTYNDTVYYYHDSKKYCVSKNTSWSSYRNFAVTSSWWLQGDLCIIYNTYSNTALYYGYTEQNYLGSYPSTSTLNGGLHLYSLCKIPTDTSTATNVYITTNNTTINNNNYEGDTIINNEGDIINPTPQPTPIPDPNDDHSTTTDPDQPDTPDSDSNLTFPILDLDLPSIDWSIGDLSHKFPFSIPFDLYNMFSILNTEPQTPEIKGEINLGIYQWSVDWNLHQFDDTAELLRNVEFVGFIIGLIFITRSLIKG